LCEKQAQPGLGFGAEGRLAATHPVQRFGQDSTSNKAYPGVKRELFAIEI
jgi:hypothetical protein